MKKPLDVGDKVGVSYGCTLNMGEYQSLKLEGWVEGTLRQGENSTTAFKRLFDVVEKQVTAKAGEFKS